MPQTKSKEQRPILLGSSSTYRAELLAKLGLRFSQASPNINETAQTNELPEDMSARLSVNKALALTQHFPKHIIIASDQCAVNHLGSILGKPHTVSKAIDQLRIMSGNIAHFYTGLCVLSPHVDTISQNSHLTSLEINGTRYHKQVIIEPYTVKFRKLTANQISNYVKRDLPLDCAGSFKSEGLGLSLFEYMQGNDPNALVGLPLIKLCKLLENIGIDVLS